MWFTQAKVLSGLLLTAALVVAGTGLATRAVLADKPNTPARPPAGLAAKAAPASRPDGQQLQGGWKVTAAEFDGKEVPADQFNIQWLVIKKDTVLAGGRNDTASELRYKTDRAKDPKWIDLAPQGSGEKAESLVGVYRFQGDKLQLCLRQGDQDRPTAFESPAGERTALLTLERLPADKTAELAKKRRDSGVGRIRSSNNLKQIGLAMHGYADANGHLPPPAVYDKKGKALLSWRVLILPYLDQEALYNEFKLDEPWDSPHNKKLLAKMPSVYAVPGVGGPQTERTYYQVFVGKGTMFEGQDGIRLSDVPDGPAFTVMVIEGGKSVPWTKPEDLPYDPKKPLPKLGGLFENGISTAYVDGSVHFIPRKKADEKTMRALITRNGAETLDPDKTP